MSPTFDTRSTAMNIVNQLFDLAEVPTEKRQAINDQADFFTQTMIERIRIFAGDFAAPSPSFSSIADAVLTIVGLFVITAALERVGDIDAASDVVIRLIVHLFGSEEMFLKDPLFHAKVTILHTSVEELMFRIRRWS